MWWGRGTLAIHVELAPRVSVGQVLPGPNGRPLDVLDGPAVQNVRRPKLWFAAERVRPAELAPPASTTGPHKSPPHGAAAPRAPAQRF